ncbi:hypothetical protein [uncultured Hyphomicrobium sp.]|uniref:hypothetical protein n=1 Tax=uncultured Hyphomicrobium sp. TaxID=194373 RepID=UPI0025E00BBB|nr:hypothetical protein [uncultured Hyphomicrobium sp.]
MSRTTLLVIASLFVLLGGAVFLAQSGALESSGPTAGTNVGGTRIEAPGTRIESDNDKTRIQAPGVDITVPRDKNGD